MEKYSVLRVSVLSSLIVLAAMLLLALSASAHSAPVQHNAAIPNAGANFTSIVHNSSGLAFSPNSIQIFLAHSSSVGVNNTTNHVQILLGAGGKQILQVAPHSTQFLNFTSTGTYTYHLQNHPKVTFTVTVS